MTVTSSNRLFRSGWFSLLVMVIALMTLSSARAASAASVHKVTLVLREFTFRPVTIQLRVGEEVELILRNEGKVAHEWAAGQDILSSLTEKGFHKDLVALLKPRVTGRSYDLEKVSTSVNASKEAAEGETGKMISTEVDVQPGGVATLRFKVPASAKGEWQMACFLVGHYESGMKGTLVIK